jgi:hypothetical protein
MSTASNETKGRSETNERLPRAVIERRRRSVSFAWLLPACAVAFAAWLGWRAWVLRGTEIVIVFDQAHGLDSGDDVRFRGMVIGEIDEILLGEDMATIEVAVRLHEQADRIARQGTRFWIVRPRVGPGGVSGLDTVIGPRYIALEPTPAAPNSNGTGVLLPPPRRHFIGLSEPPVVAEADPDDLEIVLQADTRGSLQPGTPVYFRGVQIGAVLSVGLASDGSAIEASAHIEQAYAGLLRENTRFWDSGGASIDLGITGLAIDVDSLASLMVGGITAATPPLPQAGEPVRTGHRFHVAPQPDESWLQWQPALSIGSELLPAGAMIPSMERARLTWEQGIFQRNKARSGWVLQTMDGILGPADLITTDEDARENSSRLEIAGRQVGAPARAAWERNGLARIEGEVSPRFWPRERMRAPESIEDCVVFAGRAPPLVLAAARLSESQGTWLIDRAMSFDLSWHGAAVISRVDGALVGLLLVSDGTGSVALLPGTTAE